MPDRTAGGGSSLGLGAPLGRLKTGPKLFLILSAVLLPFAILAILATLTTTRQSGQRLNRSSASRRRKARVTWRSS